MPKNRRNSKNRNAASEKRETISVGWLFEQVNEFEVYFASNLTQTATNRRIHHSKRFNK